MPDDSNDITVGGGDLERLAQWRAQQENTPRPLPGPVATEIQRRQAEIARLNAELTAYLAGVRDTLGKHSESLHVNTDDWTYTLRSGG